MQNYSLRLIDGSGNLSPWWFLLWWSALSPFPVSVWVGGIGSAWPPRRRGIGGGARASGRVCFAAL